MPAAAPPPAVAAAAMPAAAPPPAVAASVGALAPPPDLVGLMDHALAALTALAAQGALGAAHEEAAVARVLGGDAPLLLLLRHFGGRPTAARLVLVALAQPPSGATIAAGAAPSAVLAAATAAAVPTAAAAAALPTAAAAAALPTAAAASARAADGPFAAIPDAIVVGSGVAGMTAALKLLDAGARVTLLDKEARLGGNSAKASSGINGCCPPHSRHASSAANDTVATFAADTAKSARRDTAGFGHTAPMIALLVERSAGALAWLRARTAVDLSKVAQLGGHGFARTHRPANGMIGAELVFALQVLTPPHTQHIP